MKHLRPLGEQGGILIFVNRIGLVNDLSHNLRVMGFACIGLHGDMIQTERDMAISEFRQGHVTILVATDVAGRGLDIKSVKTVINYDMAWDLDSHIHRIGRTGRAGEKGVAYTMITQKEGHLAAQLVPHLEASQQPIPDELRILAAQVSVPSTIPYLMYSTYGNRLFWISMVRGDVQ
jgi:ATP-dependent RNA helicase DDX42